MKSQYTQTSRLTIQQLSALALFSVASISAHAATSTLTIKTEAYAARSSLMHYGLLSEEINYCYDGGLYAE